MGAFKRAFGLDFVDTAIHVVVTLLVAFVATEVFFAGAADDGPALAVVFGGSALYYGWRRRRARESAPPETTGEVLALHAQELEARVAELEAGQQRMAELEERLDFAERLLARDRATEALGGRE